MKIEMGESLFYSWLRHVKECQIVQTNWKVSTQWQLENADELERMMSVVDTYYSQKYEYHIFKGNTSLYQLLQQGECDVLGVSVQNSGVKYYAVDVAFHEAGLNYGTKEVTVMKVLEKCARTAFCLHGYLNTTEAEIIFASPKINPAVLSDLTPCIEKMNQLFTDNKYNFRFRIIANDEYNDLVLKPILIASEGISDTSELFLRSYQMYKMFSAERNSAERIQRRTKNPVSHSGYDGADAYKELKVGKLAQVILGRMIADGYASDEEIEAMQTFEYSKEHFDLQFPLLVRDDAEYSKVRYYAKPIYIKGQAYFMCSQWYETSANNDKPYLLRWIKEHIDRM